jgi:chromosome segregation protein
LRSYEARLREIDARVEDAQGRRRRLVNDLAATRSSITSLRGEAQSLRGNAAAYSDRFASIKGNLAATSAERGRLQQGIRAAQLGVEDARRTTEALRAPVNELRSKVAVAAGVRQAREQQRQAMVRLIESRRGALLRTEKAIENRSAEIQARKVEAATLASEQTAVHSETVALRAELAAARAQLQPLRERVAALAGTERELFDLHTNQRSALLQLERASMDAESAVNRRAQAIDKLREDIEGEGLDVPTEAAEDVYAATRLAVRVLGGGATPEDATVSTNRAPAPIDALNSRIRSLRTRIRQLGPVNAQAEVDFREARERHDFLTSQVTDLRTAEASIQEALEELRRVVRDRFRETFHAVNADFTRYFKTFFGGGTARLALTEPEDYGESGVDILAQPPGKRQQHLQLLSGGERSMAAVALLFALLQTNPAPFCVLDEVDAALDEANVQRFGDALKDLGTRTQFIVITHNRNTVQNADNIYGVSMSGDGVSTVLSLRLEDVPEAVQAG